MHIGYCSCGLHWKQRLQDGVQHKHAEDRVLQMLGWRLAITEDGRQVGAQVGAQMQDRARSSLAQKVCAVVFYLALFVVLARTKMVQLDSVLAEGENTLQRV